MLSKGFYILVLNLSFCLLSVSANENFIENVKSNHFRCSERSSIGRLLNEWKDCSVPVWSSFTSDTGRQIVEAQCTNNSMTKWHSLLAGMSPLEYESLFDLRSYDTSLRWGINVDGTVELISAEAIYYWADELFYSDTLYGDGRTEVLNAICLNNPLLPNEIIAAFESLKAELPRDTNGNYIWPENYRLDHIIRNYRLIREYATY